MVTKEQILAGLREVVDPEIGANVVDLGFIRDILIESDRVHVKMVLTIPGCPLARFLLTEVRRKVESVTEGRPVNVELLDEPWTPPWLQAEE